MGWTTGGRRKDGIFLFSPLRLDQAWGPPSLLSNGYWGDYFGDKACGAWSWPLSSTEGRC